MSDWFHDLRREGLEKLEGYARSALEGGSKLEDLARRLNVPPATIAHLVPSQPAGATSEDQAKIDARKAEREERELHRRDIEEARAALGRLIAARPATPQRAAPMVDPERDRLQRRADLLAELRPMLVEEETEREKQRLARKAMRRLGR